MAVLSAEQSQQRQRQGSKDQRHLQRAPACCPGLEGIPRVIGRCRKASDRHAARLQPAQQRRPGRDFLCHEGAWLAFYSDAGSCQEGTACRWPYRAHAARWARARPQGSKPVRNHLAADRRLQGQRRASQARRSAFEHSERAVEVMKKNRPLSDLNQSAFKSESVDHRPGPPGPFTAFKSESVRAFLWLPLLQKLNTF